MKPCRAIQEVLPEIAAGRTVPGGEQILLHLAHCEACAAVYRELQALTAFLAAAPPPPASIDGTDRARQALRAAALVASQWPGARRSRPSPAFAVRFAVGAALAAGLLLWAP